LRERILYRIHQGVARYREITGFVFEAIVGYNSCSLVVISSHSKGNRHQAQIMNDLISNHVSSKYEGNNTAPKQTNGTLTSDEKSMLIRWQRLLIAHNALLRRHRYLSEQLTSIQTKIIEAPPAWALDPQLNAQLDATSQRIQALQNDKWLDELFSIAHNELQVQEIENLMDNWGQASYDSVAHCIVDHANRHGFPGEYLKYLRKADHFNKKRSKKRTPEPGVTRWKKHSGEYLIERDGKIVSYSLK
jgi:hypothetical protein